MSNHNFVDFTGKRFGRLLVLSRANDFVSEKSKATAWNCVCDCGKAVSVRASSMVVGDTKSCGCLRRDVFVEKSSKRTRTPEYKIYQGILARCLNQNVSRYANYGGRGIRVCKRWLDSFDNFMNDMGRRPSNSHSIERIDNNGDYCPESCKWATIEEQAKNRTSNYYIEFKGERMILNDWAKRIGINHSNLKKRIEKWGVEVALTKPVRIGDFRNKIYITTSEAQQ